MKNENWNEEGFFSGITEDFSNYTWFKGEPENPYEDDKERELADIFWNFERDFHIRYMKGLLNNLSLKDAYAKWLTIYLTDMFIGHCPEEDTYEDNLKIFKKGSRY